MAACRGSTASRGRPPQSRAPPSAARAAAELQLSKATVSKAVSRLEAKLGARLFNRTSRRLSLTEAGKAYYDRCTHILADLEQADAVYIGSSLRGLRRVTTLKLRPASDTESRSNATQFG